MPKTLKKSLKLLLPLLVPMFALRPVVVSIHNGDVSSNVHETKACSGTCQQISAPHVFLHSVDREAPDVVVLTPPVFKEGVSPLMEGRLSVVSASLNTSPKSFLVLRI